MSRKKLEKGIQVKGFSADVPGTWKVISVRPWVVQAAQNGKKWIIKVSKEEFLERLREQE